MTPSLGFAKRPLVEASLIGVMAMGRSHRAGAAGATAFIHAISAFQGVDMSDAGRNIISGRRKGGNRASAEAGFVDAALAWAGAPIGLRHVKQLAKAQRSAPSVP